MKRILALLSLAPFLLVACSGSEPTPQQVCDHIEELHANYDGEGWDFDPEQCLTDAEEFPASKRRCVLGAEDGGEAITCIMGG